MTRSQRSERSTTHRGTEALRTRKEFLGASVPRCVVVLVCVWSAIGIAQEPQAQQPPPQQSQAVFRTTTRLIVQTVTVKDKDGKPVEGLTAKDFTITEDGVAQDIAFVEFQRLLAAPAATDAPQAAPEPAPIAARPATTATTVAPVIEAAIAPATPGSIKYQDKRLLVMYFDGSSMGPADG